MIVMLSQVLGRYISTNRKEENCRKANLAIRARW